MKTTSNQNKMRIQITDRDLLVLRLLWKWKLVSTSSLALKFFPDATLQTAYRRILSLSGAGLITSIYIKPRWQECWSLTQKGYKYIRPHLPELAVEGFKSENPHHDHLVTAFHLGEWLIHQPEYTQTYSEQQLRRVPTDLWPDWIPQSDRHRPDGYSLYFKDEKKVVVAVEVELSVKTRQRYAEIVAFYDAQNSIQLVFWLVESHKALNRIKIAFEKFHVREWSKHHFVLLSDFQTNGWSAAFVEGRFKGNSPWHFLSHLPHTRATLEAHKGVTLTFLNLAKKPVVSIPSKKSKTPQNTD